MGNAFGKSKTKPKSVNPTSETKTNDYTKQMVKRQTENMQIVRALYDYQGMNDDDLVFSKGDQMEIIDQDDPDWWKARKLSNNSVGYIPRNFVVLDDNSLEAQEWWFDMDRRQASAQLGLPENEIGAFLVRRAERNGDDGASEGMALSLLVSRDPTAKPIRHYRINEENGQVFVIAKTYFNNLIELVNYYRENPISNFCTLKHPCIRETKNVPFKSLQVDRRKLKFLESLGNGNFGEVQKAIFNGNSYVAVKKLKEQSLMKTNEFENEARVMHALRHPRLVQLMGICMEKEPHYIITEFMSQGSLQSYLRNNDSKMDLNQLVDLAAEVADGMTYLESRNPPFIHRDLRAANCLVNDNGIAKVADFGLAKMVDDGIYEGGETCKFPVKWTAPEGLKTKSFSVKSDVWSYGILMYEIFTVGKLPYPGWEHDRIKREVLSGYILTIMPHPRIACPKEISDIMKSCLNQEPEERPTFKKLHQYLTNFDSSYQTFEEK